MNSLKPGYLDIPPRELARFLLKETGHANRDNVNPKDILDLLKLDFLAIDFIRELELATVPSGRNPRALLSYPERLVAVDASMTLPARVRFSTLHEIAHYVLPDHQNAMYLCDTAGMSVRTSITFEKQANDFAADLLFMGDRFTLDANSGPATAGRVKELATKYEASFEAIARRLAEKFIRPCMLVVFKRRVDDSLIDTSTRPTWQADYCVASQAFKSRYFSSVSGEAPTEVADQVDKPGRDIADSVVLDLSIRLREESTQFRAEFFSNSYSILCLLLPQIGAVSRHLPEQYSPVASDHPEGTS